jgi:hypothetical protein
MFTKGSCLSDIPSDFTNEFTYLYSYDSYDQTALMGPAGQRTPDPDTGQPGFQISYSVDWTGSEFLQLPAQNDAPNQLKYPSAPPGRTVLTLCTYHAVIAHSDRCPAIFASGTARTMPIKDIYERPWNLPPP